MSLVGAGGRKLVARYRLYKSINLSLLYKDCNIDTACFADTALTISCGAGEAGGEANIGGILVGCND